MKKQKEDLVNTKEEVTYSTKEETIEATEKIYDINNNIYNGLNSIVDKISKDIGLPIGEAGEFANLVREMESLFYDAYISVDIFREWTDMCWLGYAHCFSTKTIDEIHTFIELPKEFKERGMKILDLIRYLKPYIKPKDGSYADNLEKQATNILYEGISNISKAMSIIEKEKIVMELE